MRGKTEQLRDVDAPTVTQRPSLTRRRTSKDFRRTRCRSENRCDRKCDGERPNRLVHRVVHHLCARVFGDDTFEIDAPSGRDAENLAPAEEHSCERAVTVGDRRLERIGAGPGNDADRPHFTGDPHGLAHLDGVERRKAFERAPFFQVLTVDLLDRLRQPVDEFPQCHDKFPSLIPTLGDRDAKLVGSCPNSSPVPRSSGLRCWSAVPSFSWASSRPSS